MIATTLWSGTGMGSSKQDEVPERVPTKLSTFAAEAVGTFVVSCAVFAALPLARTLTDATTMTGVLAGVMVAAAVILVGAVIAPFSGAHLNPLVSFARVAQDRLAHEDCVRYVVAQLVGASVAGVVSGTVGVDSAAFPKAVGESVGLEALIAATLVIVTIGSAPLGERRRAIPAGAALGGFVIAFGWSWLGNPAIAIAAAFAKIADGSVPMIAYVVGAQAFGGVLAIVIARATFAPSRLAES